jgi:ribosomal protein L22
MPYKATHRFARTSARKLRPLATMIRGKFADEALDILKYQPQRGARMLVGKPIRVRRKAGKTGEPRDGADGSGPAGNALGWPRVWQALAGLVGGCIPHV